MPDLRRTAPQPGHVADTSKEAKPGFQHGRPFFWPWPSLGAGILTLCFTAKAFHPSSSDNSGALAYNA
ncbi:hypothetical protein QQM79_21105, partial [Marinobacteraceae bacterium S3BR75-40.1]